MSFQDALQSIFEHVRLEDLATAAGADFGKHRQNGSLRAACPLHHGDNPTSFVIHPKNSRHDRDTWFCYVEGKGGDSLEFFMRWRGITDYETGLLELARYANVQIDWQPDPRRAEAEKERRLKADVLDQAQKFYAGALFAVENKGALDYLLGRGFTEETIRAAGFGFTRSDTALFDYLKANQVDLKLAQSSGLVRFADHCDFTANADGRTYGPNGYITIPHFVYGRVAHFSSRAVEPIPDPKKKTLSMPGSLIPCRAEHSGPSGQAVIVVEGPMAAWSLWQLGFSAWAMCGLKGIPYDRELEDLKDRKAVYVSPDADGSGQKAITDISSGLARLCKALGPLTLVLAQIPADTGAKDFNDWLKKESPCTTTEIDELLKASETWFETRCRAAKGCPAYELDERQQEIGEMLSLAPESSKAWYYRRAKEILSLTKKECEDLARVSQEREPDYTAGSIKNKAICFMGRPMGNFWSRITEEQWREDGQSEPDIRYKITGGLQSGEVLQEIEIPASEFIGMNWIQSKWGYRPILHARRGELFDLARAIQEVSTDVKRKRVYCFTGWVDIEGKWSYLSSSGAISAAGIDPAISVDLGENNLVHYELPAPPEGEAAYMAARASVAFMKVGSRAVTAILWGAMYAAPLTSLKPLYAVLWVYGTTQSGKSTISHLALSHFGTGFLNGRSYRAPIEFSLSTFVSIENACFVTKDAPIILDDFVPKSASRQEAAEQHKIAANIVRAVGNRSGKGRGQANLKERKTKAPRGMVIATAENPLMGQSTVGRMIYIPVARPDVFGDGNNPLLDAAQAQGQEGLYAQAMALFVKWLAANYEKVKDEFHDRVERQSAWMRKEYPNIQSRLPDYFGLLCEAQGLALEAFEDLGLISTHERWEEYKANRAAIAALVVRQAETISAESPVRKVFIALANMIQRGTGYLAPRKGPGKTIPQGRPDPVNPDCWFPPMGAELIGWFDPENRSEIYLDAETILSVAKAYWRALDENLDIFPDTLRQQIDQAGILSRKGDSKHREINIHIQGIIGRHLAISPERVEALYDVQLLPSED